LLVVGLVFILSIIAKQSKNSCAEGDLRKKELVAAISHKQHFGTIRT